MTHPPAPASLGPEPLAALLGRIQAHIRSCGEVITNDQLLLGELAREIDDFSLRVTATAQQRNVTAHAHADGLVVLNNLRQHVEKTTSAVRDIFRTLGRLEPLLAGVAGGIVSPGEYPRLKESFDKAID